MPLKKFVGKPYAGKPHVRIDEGAGKEIFSFSLYSTGFVGPPDAGLFPTKRCIELAEMAQRTLSVF